MRFVLTIGVSLIALAIAASANAAAPCQEPKLEAVASDHPECQFFKGTRHFREKEYSAALQEWMTVIDTKEIPKEFEYLLLDAQNNVGFLYYMGMGTQKNPDLAIQQYWLPAERAGHEEATYHLCHAYADEKPKLALGYCREAIRRYEKLGGADEGNREVIGQLRRYILRLETK
jgi:TPR repeat protein